jgi:hypothetical protein
MLTLRLAHRPPAPGPSSLSRPAEHRAFHPPRHNGWPPGVRHGQGAQIRRATAEPSAPKMSRDLQPDLAPSDRKEVLRKRLTRPIVLKPAPSAGDPNVRFYLPQIGKVLGWAHHQPTYALEHSKNASASPPSQLSAPHERNLASPSGVKSDQPRAALSIAHVRLLRLGRREGAKLARWFSSPSSQLFAFSGVCGGPRLSALICSREQIALKLRAEPRCPVGSLDRRDCLGQRMA